MLPITDITGDTQLLTNVKTVVRSRKVNGEKTIQFITIPDDSNDHSFAHADNESTIIFDEESYIIKKVNEKSVGATSIKQIGAVHTFFNKMINCYQYDLFSGSQTFSAALTRVFSPTPYTFVIVDAFLANEFENFGRENCLGLFKKVLERYGAEFRIVGTVVYLETEIGAKTDFQLRWKSNIKALDKQVDTDSLATVIRGYGGKPDETTGVYPVEVEYRSPNEILFGELHADAVYDERLSTIDGMTTHLQKKITDEPQLSITVDIAELGGDVKNEGDRGYIIYEPMGITLEARIIEITETFEYVDAQWKVMKTDVTLANLRNKLTDVTTMFAMTSKRVDRLFEGNERLPYNVLPEAVRIATETLQSAQTELIFENGITGVDPNDPNLLTKFTSRGIGVSSDGGATFPEAITGNGIVTSLLTAGDIHTNNIRIVGENDLFFWDGNALIAYNPLDLAKYAKLNSDGLYIAKGAMTIERPDGYAVMNNGLLKNEFTIQPTSPPFTALEVDIAARYWRTTSANAANCNAFYYRHDSRYLKIQVVLHDSASGFGSRISIHEIGNGSAQLAQTVVYGVSEVDATNTPVTLTIDLGIPTGMQRGFYLRLNTNTGGEARGRLLKAWLEG